jgi:hypothetical protein
VLKWNQGTEIRDDTQIQLLNYLENGGSLFCTTEKMIIHERNMESENSMASFLRNNFGVALTNQSVKFRRCFAIKKNLAKYSHFKHAMSDLSAIGDLREQFNYFNTVLSGFDAVNGDFFAENYQLLKIFYLELLVILQSLSPFSTKKRRVLSQCAEKCLQYLKCVKAPLVWDFPGDFEILPSLEENVQIVAKANFAEILSTSFYAPAGFEIKVKVLSENFDGWVIRIGAHNNHLTELDKRNRSPIITVEQPLEKEFSIWSKFGGLIYILRYDFFLLL